MTLDLGKLDLRPLREEDRPSIIDIDARVTGGSPRNAYYERKVAAVLDERGSIGISLVAVYDGEVVGFVMGNILTGEFGIPDSTAVLDTIGIDPDFGGQGIGTQLFEEYVGHVKAAGVTSLQTVVDWNNSGLLKFFNKTGFVPSTTLYLEKRV